MVLKPSQSTTTDPNHTAWLRLSRRPHYCPSVAQEGPDLAL